MTDKRARCGEQGLGHGDMCILRPGHEGDHVHQPKGQPKTSARTWPRKPTLADGVKKPGLGAGQKDYRTTPKDGHEDQRAKRGE